MIRKIKSATLFPLETDLELAVIINGLDKEVANFPSSCPNTRAMDAGQFSAFSLEFFLSVAHIVEG
jgi:hypothetical protein